MKRFATIHKEGTAATHAATDFLLAASNLSDLASVATARTNLGLGTAATQTYSDPADWTPTVTPATGAFGSVTLNRAKYARMGAMYVILFDYTITTVGTAAGAVTVSLPAAPTWDGVMRGRDINNGVGLMAPTLGSNMLIVNDSNTTPIQANARLRISGVYFA